MSKIDSDSLHHIEHVPVRDDSYEEDQREDHDVFADIEERRDKDSSQVEKSQVQDKVEVALEEDKDREDPELGIICAGEVYDDEGQGCQDEAPFEYHREGESSLHELHDFKQAKVSAHC